MSFLSKLFSKPTPPPPMATATVTTPEIIQGPRGYYWDRLHACRTRDDVIALYNECKLHGYGENGQLMTAIKEKLK